MSTKTDCGLCVFAKPATENNGCDLGIIDNISQKKEIVISDTGYNNIYMYRCPFAFSKRIYDQHIESIGSKEKLTEELIRRAEIKYYMVIFVTDINDIDNICQHLNSLPILPKFVSIILYKNNETSTIIDKMKNNLNKNIEWKLHNILETTDPQESLDIVLNTNDKKQNADYLWINNSDSCEKWKNEISLINHVITIEQPVLHAMFRSKNDGLLLGFNNYYALLTHINTNIWSAIDHLDKPHIFLYA